MTLLLAACVDTTGLTADSMRTVRGNPNAVVVVQEFADLRCPGCASAQRAINEPLLQKYASQIRFEYRHFPLASHAYSRDAAEAAECAADQNKFWEFVDVAFEKQGQLKNRNTLFDWAKELSLDQDLFDRCMRSRIKRATVNADYEGGKQLGVSGTPTYLVNGTMVPSRLPDLSAAVEDILSQVKSKL